MTTDEYQGWTNRETWAAALWINNDQGLQEEAMELAARDRGAERLEQWVDDLGGHGAGDARRDHQRAPHDDSRHRFALAGQLAGNPRRAPRVLSTRPGE